MDWPLNYNNRRRLTIVLTIDVPKTRLFSNKDVKVVIIISISGIEVTNASGIATTL